MKQHISMGVFVVVSTRSCVYLKFGKLSRFLDLGGFPRKLRHCNTILGTFKGTVPHLRNYSMKLFSAKLFISAGLSNP